MGSTKLWSGGKSRSEKVEIKTLTGGFVGKAGQGRVNILGLASVNHSGKL